MIQTSTRVFRDAKATLAESIYWSGGTELLWCDIPNGLLHRSPLTGREDGSDDTVLALPAPLASFAPAPGGFVASLEASVVLVDAAGGIDRELAALPHPQPEMRLNEGKCDPFGRWITGSMDPTGSSDAAIYSIDSTGELHVLRVGLGIANGFEWSLDGSTMYFTDTERETIYRAGYGPEGLLVAPEIVHVGEKHDGLTIDAEGCLWSGIFGSSKVVRYSPDGEELQVVELPAPNITSVAFGGEGLSTLFVASGREGLADEELEAHPQSGGVFAIDCDVPGLPPRVFGVPSL